MQQSPLATGKKQRQKRRRIALRIIRPAELPVANPGSRENGRLALFLGRVGNAAVAVMVRPLRAESREGPDDTVRVRRLDTR